MPSCCSAIASLDPRAIRRPYRPRACSRFDWWGPESQSASGSRRLSAGNSGALYAPEVFEQACGEVVAFVPVTERVADGRRARTRTIPAAELAVTIHHGAHDDFDRSYGTLGRYIAERRLRVAEPVREYYLIGPRHTADPAQWRTEIAWPIVR
jgi:hypothetical protein